MVHLGWDCVCLYNSSRVSVHEGETGEYQYMRYFGPRLTMYEQSIEYLQCITVASR